MGEKRQKNQNQLAFGSSGQVKLVSSDRKGPECLWWREKPKARMESFASGGSKSQLIRTAVYGTVRTVVWEGRMGDCPPYPDQEWLRHELAHDSSSRVTICRNDYKEFGVCSAKGLVSLRSATILASRKRLPRSRADDGKTSPVPSSCCEIPFARGSEWLPVFLRVVAK